MTIRQHGTARRRQGLGFSIIEVMVGTTILTISLMGLASTLPTAEWNVHRGGQNTKANALAQQLLENIRNDPFNQLTLYNGQNGNGVDTRNPDNFPVDNPSPPVVGNPGNFTGGTNLTRWKNDIALVFSQGAGITGGYGTVLVVSVAQDGAGNSILNKVTVTVYWTESGIYRSLTLSTLVSGI